MTTKNRALRAYRIQRIAWWQLLRLAAVDQPAARSMAGRPARPGAPAVPAGTVSLHAGTARWTPPPTRARRAERLADGAPNVLIVLIDGGPGTPRPTAARSTRRRSIGWRRRASPSTASIPLPCARRPGPRCSPAQSPRGMGNGRLPSPTTSTASAGPFGRSSATVAEVLKDSATAPAPGASRRPRPKSRSRRWGRSSTGRPVWLRTFYGFLAGEASQTEPTLHRNTTRVTGISRRGTTSATTLRPTRSRGSAKQKAYAPDKPFFMYWAPGVARPAPDHEGVGGQVQGQVRRRLGQDRERVFARAKAKGWIPQNAQLTPRPASMASWDSIPEAERPFQRRLMEVFAGFTEHADYNAGRVIDEIAKQGKLDNTLIFYIWGDNGSSSRACTARSASSWRRTAFRPRSRSLEALKELGGLDALGGPKTDNMYPTRPGPGWAARRTRAPSSRGPTWRRPAAAGRRLAESHQGRSDGRPQFHHVIDVVPTIYELTKITPPRVVNGSSRIRSPASAWSIRLAIAKAPGHAEDPVLRHHGQPRDLQRRLVCERAGPRESRGWAGCRRASRNGRP